ncbi:MULTISPECIES: LLM class flavin-dependent oxidoreductase [Bacillus]|uniref:Luciferase-like domain-containing protein n=2 Tax=Bacillus TaxID=1386 RepID=A0A0M5JEJ4_9BACI|nr:MULTISPECIES: LLM class flavin-dependent oxidoreductase [Bacillus]ALC82807.1 hypothetical protein AM592_15350 [Bacillus gobiensis]MBP1081768.1 luciferase family oxidoreductase group 1 [Bacillus capparidis]MED1096419.1 LLM class flavin-dependent oxidoreductase [Bacillus capparidis]
MKLSILDQSPISEGSSAEAALKQTIELAKYAEALGYERFWVSEHHFSKSLAGSSPEVLVGAIAAQTKTIRVGSGGVMLQHYSPYKVAENFRVLEGLFPGRIDLGIGRAPGGMPISSMALQESKRRRVDIDPEQLDDLVAYLYDLADENHRYPNLTAAPHIQSAPELWMLGSSGKSAQTAARLGASYTFALFINGEGGEEAVRSYKKKFTSTVAGQKAKAAVAVFVLCAETEKEAENLAVCLDFALLANEQGMLRNGFPSLKTAISYSYSQFEKARVEENRKRMVVGDPQSVKKQLHAIANAYETDELMIVTITHNFQDKLNSYRLLADVILN